MQEDIALFTETKTVLEQLLAIFSCFNCPLEHKEALEKTIYSLSEPCRLAITGRVKAGKSTLINVLLGGDYAKVGVSETTATINIFKYGIPKFPNKPILCKFLSGEFEWISKEELNALQGYQSDIINKISDIESLTYYLEDERLKNVTIIDTPGIDAVVGADGDAHQEQTESFLGLRKRHKDQTIELSNNADAVILLLGDVSHESDIDFIDGFLRSRGVSSSINTIGVLSQIDLTDERIAKRKENAHERYLTLSKYLNCVVPISAGLKYHLPSINEAYQIKSVLSKVTSGSLLSSVLLRSPQIYFQDKIPGISIPLADRKRIYPEGIPFRCFSVLAKHLYSMDVEEAIREINEISGIDRLFSIIDCYFFKRSRHIKAEIAIKQALLIIWDVLNCHDGEFIVDSNHSSAATIANDIHLIQLRLEELKEVCGNSNKYFQCLSLLTENNDLFAKDELEELKLLFSEEKCSFSDARLQYWFGQSNLLMNETKRYLARQAYNRYTELFFNQS